MASSQSARPPTLVDIRMSRSGNNSYDNEAELRQTETD